MSLRFLVVLIVFCALQSSRGAAGEEGLRRGAASQSRRWPTGDIRLSGVHAH